QQHEHAIHTINNGWPTSPSSSASSQSNWLNSQQQQQPTTVRLLTSMPYTDAYFELDQNAYPNAVEKESGGGNGGNGGGVTGGFRRVRSGSFSIGSGGVIGHGMIVGALAVNNNSGNGGNPGSNVSGGGGGGGVSILWRRVVRR
ncbi:hypothetical protein HDU76_007199, partial [Blyttiomyces sp. JEL0837]